jgi:hypothetical protein
MLRALSGRFAWCPRRPRYPSARTVPGPAGVRRLPGRGVLPFAARPLGPSGHQHGDSGRPYGSLSNDSISRQVRGRSLVRRNGEGSATHRALQRPPDHPEQSARAEPVKSTGPSDTTRPSVRPSPPCDLTSAEPLGRGFLNPSGTSAGQSATVTAPGAQAPSRDAAYRALLLDAEEARSAAA